MRVHLLQDAVWAAQLSELAFPRFLRLGRLYVIRLSSKNRSAFFCIVEVLIILINVMGAFHCLPKKTALVDAPRQYAHQAPGVIAVESVGARLDT